MTLRRAVFVAACTVLSATPISAQTADVRVSFANGRVSVAATGATLGDILREWARAGGSRFVNVDRIPVVERMTIRLENETELRALDILLRPLAGYAVTAKSHDAPGLSSVGRVLLMPGPSRPMVYGQTPSAPYPTPAESNRQAFGGPPRPDDDGPTRREMPPPFPNAGLPQDINVASSGQPAPMGQSSPLQGAQTQTVPGLGVVTSSQPGAVIPSPNQNPNTARPGGRPGITPTQPRPGGGGG